MPTTIQTPTANISKSIDFYKRLNFKDLSTDNQNLVTDGQVHIEINENKFARAGIKLYKENWKEEIESLKKITTIHSIENGHLLADPSNCWIYLIDSGPDFSIDKEPCFSTLGNFAGISLETTDLPRSLDLYKILGFEKSMGSAEQGWIALKNQDDFSVSLMKPNSCPHLFFNPSLTYFNGGKNLPVIKKIREAGIEITEEITHFNDQGIVDNVIIRDPGGYGFFIFND